MKKVKVAVFSYIDISNLLSGQQRRVNDLLLGLKQEFTVDYIHFSDCADNDKLKLQLAKLGIGYVKLTTGFKGKLSRILISLIHHLLFPFTGLKKSIFQAGLSAFHNRDFIRNIDYEIVIAEYFMLSTIFYYTPNRSKKVIDMHDLQVLTLESQLDSRRFVPFKKIQILIARKYEVACLSKSDAVLAVNYNEIDYLRNRITSKLIYCPLTIQNYKESNLSKKPPLSVIRLGYFAGLSSKRSYNELKTIIQVYFNVISLDYPGQIDLLVFGSNPSIKMKELCITNEVKLLGETHDLTGTFASVHFLINYWLEKPYGFRTRIIDALSTGTPVIVNSACIDGMKLIKKPGVILCENLDDLRSIIAHYRANENRYNQLCKEARATADIFSPEVIYKNVNREISALL